MTGDVNSSTHACYSNRVYLSSCIDLGWSVECKSQTLPLRCYCASYYSESPLDTGKIDAIARQNIQLKIYVAKK